MLIPLSTLAVYTLAAIVLAATPGPDMLFCLSRSIGDGPRAAFISLLGITTGCYLYALAAAFGLAGLIDLAPRLYHAVRLAGALYLLWLAIEAFRPTSTTAAPAARRAAAWPVLYRQGLLTNLLNPKIALFYLALFPQFVDPARGSSVAQALILATIHNAFGLLANGGVILAAGRFVRLLAARPTAARLQRWFMGTVFAGLALRLALDDRR